MLLATERSIASHRLHAALLGCFRRLREGLPAPKPLLRTLLLALRTLGGSARSQPSAPSEHARPVPPWTLERRSVARLETLRTLISL